MFKELDTDGDGHITFNECKFIELFLQLFFL